MVTKPITFKSVRAYGGAGGSDRGANITVHIDGKADTVQAVENLVRAAPDAVEVIKYILDTENLSVHGRNSLDRWLANAADGGEQDVIIFRSDDEKMGK